MKKYFITFAINGLNYNCTINAENKPQAEVMGRFKMQKEFPEFTTGKKNKHTVTPVVKIVSCVLIDFEF